MRIFILVRQIVSPSLGKIVNVDARSVESPQPLHLMNNTTEIAFVLDKSGSMQLIVNATIQGFNEFLKNQQEEHAQLPVKMSLTLFDTELEQPYVSVPVIEVPPLSLESYKPEGSTALLDAIGVTITSLGAKLAATPEAERAGKVVVCILTDGEENSSRRYNWIQISDMIRHQREVYSWDFIFLGANQDAIATAARINIDQHDSAIFFQRDAGVGGAIRSSTRRVSSLKSRQASQVSLQTMVNEETANLEV